MDATSNFGIRFAQASGPNAGLPERLLRRQALDRTVTGLSLISQGLAFSIFGMLIIANRHQADLNDFAGGGFVATVGGRSFFANRVGLHYAAFRCFCRVLCLKINDLHHENNILRRKFREVGLGGKPVIAD
jgi:hypothetical protein